MRGFVGETDRPGRAAIGVVVGGAIAFLGGLLTDAETRPAPGRVVVIDDAGLRIMPGLAVALMVLGWAMTRAGGRRRWWAWAAGLAMLGFIGVLTNWIMLLIGVDAFRVPTTERAPEVNRLVVGLPLYLVGCLVAAVCAARARAGTTAPDS